MSRRHYDGLDRTLTELGLSVEQTLDENDRFVVLRCRDSDRAPVVLKFLHGESPDATARLRKEALLTRTLDGSPPLRLLAHRDDGPRYLLTGFDPGTPLALDPPERSALRAAATALARFQECRPPGEFGGSRIYLLKGTAKHLLHVVPAHLSPLDALRCLGRVLRALPAIGAHSSCGHGDFLPSNVLYHDEDETVTFTDLEGFMSSSHPFMDVLSLCTVDETEITSWGWQRDFVHTFTQARGWTGLGARERATLARAYDGLLVFFLLYRLSEARVNAIGANYFDGLGKWDFLRKRIGDWLHPGRWRRERTELGDALARRKLNLTQALDRSAVRRNREIVLDPASPGPSR